MKEAEIAIVYDNFSGESVIKIVSKSGNEIHMAFPNARDLERWFQILNQHKNFNSSPPSRFKSGKTFGAGLKGAAHKPREGESFPSR